MEKSDSYVSQNNSIIQLKEVFDSLSPDETDDTYNIELFAGDPADNNARFEEIVN